MAMDGLFTYFDVERLEKVGNNERDKNGGKWAALAGALIHEKGAPCAISPFVVDGPHMFVEECGEGGYISGKESETEMTLKKASWETLLNWFVRPKKTAVREGKMPDDWVKEIYFSTCSCIGVPMA
jgi:hypothetical protein